MAATANLRLKGSRFHFRRKIPYNLVSRFGRSEIVRSLQTSERRVAAARARFVWLQVEGIFEKVLQEPTLTREQIDGLLKTAAADVAWADEIRLARTGQLFDHHGCFPLDADALVLETEAQTWREELARNDISSVKNMVQTCSEKAGLRVRPDTVDERLLGRALLKMLAENADQTAARLRREVYPFLPVRTTEDELPTNGSGPDLDAGIVSSDIFPYRDQNELLSQVGERMDGEEERLGASCSAVVGLTFDQAWTDTVEDLIANKRWDKGRAAHAASSRKLWLEFVGNSYLSDMSKKQAIGFRRSLSRLPETYHRDKRWRDIPLLQVIEEADRLEGEGKEALPRMSSKTVNRHISQLKRMWIEFETLEHVSKEQPNPFDHLHIPVKKSRSQIREERDQFTLAELKILFSAPVWTGCRSSARRKDPGSMIIRDWKFWVPLIGAFSGMRREEICALKVCDLEQASGVWIVNLRQAKMRLKTPGSPRYVPLHDTLLRIGFIRDLVKGRAADEWLFPDLTPSALTDRRGEPFGKWFTPLRRDLGIYRPKVVFHSFRHTVSTALHNAEAHHPFIEEIIGHDSGERHSELARYTKETLIQNLKSTIDRLDYGINFCHLVGM